MYSSFPIPGFLYGLLPWIYIAAGIATLSSLRGLIGTASALLFISAGVLVLNWRRAHRLLRPSPAPRSVRPSPRQRRPSKRRPAGAGRTPIRPAVAPAPRPAASRQPPAGSPAASRASAPGPRTPPVPGHERRSGSDRRGWQPMPRTPFVDGNGAVVVTDRRRLPDRRHRNLVVTEC